MRRRLTFAVEALVVGIVAVALLVRWMEPRIAFYPTRGETETPRTYGVPFDAQDIATPEGDRLRAWIMRAPNPRANIVYFHGNGGNLSNWAPILTGIVQHGYSVFAFDYRGYGLSSGRPTELGLYHDAGIIANRAWSAEAASVPRIYWGRSLGATMAAYAATARTPDGLILESGFPNARAAIRDSPVLVILSLFGSYRFPTAEFANRTKSPALVMHGTRDSVIPFAAGRELYERLAGPKQFVAIDGGDHNDTVPRQADTYWAAIDRFVASLHR
jgi:uncharacterized protein